MLSAGLDTFSILPMLFDAFSCLIEQEKHPTKKLDKMLSKMDPASRPCVLALSAAFPAFSSRKSKFTVFLMLFID